METSTLLPQGWETSPLAQELKTYLAHQAEWLIAAPGKYALIKGEEVVGLYDGQDEAFTVGYGRFRWEAFMVQRIQESFDTYYIGGSGLKMGQEKT